jgi:predicted KAP-like P-loop ATPase
MWNDNETRSDSIDYSHLIGAVTGIIDNPALLPSSIGIFGDWGSGKSSLMGMVEDKYKEVADVLVIRFNGWLFEGYEDAKTVLMSRIVDEIIEKRTLEEKALKLAVKLLQKIDLMKIGSSVIKHGAAFLAAGPPGLAISTGIEALGKLKSEDYEKYIKDKKEKKDPDHQLRTNINEFHWHFEELLKETGVKKVIVFIDDLDRCSPDTIIGTLEAIKLFLFAKDTAFVIGADERLIRYAVRRRFPEIPGDSTEVGRDYLEKLIQYPIRIPPMNAVELTNYVNLLFAELLMDPGEFGIVKGQIMQEKQKRFDFTFDVNNADAFLNNFTTDLRDSFQLSAQVVPILRVILNGNPRQTKRFLNTLLIRHNMARARGVDLNKRVLAKIMLLEYFRPEVFDTFHRLQADNGGVIPNIKALETKAGEWNNSSTVTPPGAASPEEDLLLKDPWTRDWLASAPSLDQKDLGPHYYFSRDKLAVKDLRLQRMSPRAQEFYKAMTSDTDAVFAKALTETPTLNAGDAGVVFEAMCQKTRESGTDRDDKSPMVRLFLFCEKRPDLHSQMLAFLDKLPEREIMVSEITRLEGLTRNSPLREDAKKLVARWSASSVNTILAGLAKRKLNEFN